MKTWYSGLKDRYNSFPADVQVLNMVSDLDKAANLLETNRESAVNHLYRAIILIDYMAADAKWKWKLKELIRLREAVASLICTTKPLGSIRQIISVALQMDPGAYRKYKSI
jgi:hypothetical protein